MAGDELLLVGRYAVPAETPVVDFSVGEEGWEASADEVVHFFLEFWGDGGLWGGWGRRAGDEVAGGSGDGVF